MARSRVQAKVRDKDSAAVRRAGLLPAVLYGHSVENSLLTVEAALFHKVLREAGTATLIDLTIGENTHAVLIREVQRHPVTEMLLHVDFYKVRLDEAIQARVPISFVGSSHAVKELGGVLVRTMDEIEVEALPEDLPHTIEVDISTLREFDAAVHIADLSLPKGVKVLHKSDEVVALVQAPRTEEELAALSEEVKEEVEAVEGVKEKEEEKPGEESKGEKKTKEQAESA